MQALSVAGLRTNITSYCMTNQCSSLGNDLVRHVKEQAIVEPQSNLPQQHGKIDAVMKTHERCPVRSLRANHTVGNGLAESRAKSTHPVRDMQAQALSPSDELIYQRLQCVRMSSNEAKGLGGRHETKPPRVASGVQRRIQLTLYELSTEFLAEPF
jgi:hypothetical protein